MKKNTIKAFTLVEMLIVIVIIWILIASLMPRMQQAQARARDVTRKNDLSQMQTAIISYYWDANKLPSCGGGLTSCEVSVISGDLKAGGLDKLPTDPITSQKYYYGVTSRNDHPNQWFRLAANVEVAWVANYPMSGGNNPTSDIVGDTAQFKPCKYVSEWQTRSVADKDNCTGTGGSFWYIITY